MASFRYPPGTRGGGGPGPLGLSLELLNDIGRMGLVIVPEKPSPAMLRAGSRAAAGAIDEGGAGRVWGAMLGAVE